MNDTGEFPLSDVPSEAFEKLQGLMPQVSEDDRAKVHKVFARPAIFGSLSRQHQDALKASILETYCMIPSMGLFSAHMRFLEKVSTCMKELLKIGGKEGKRGQGCLRPLENVLKGLYTAEKNIHDEYQIQTMDGWRPIQAPFEDRQELSCRQLWLFVMRHDDPASIDQKHLAYVAKQLGFYSRQIEKHASEYTSSGDAEASPGTWADFSDVRRKQRLGQKGGRWLENTKQARKRLFFDVAETIGTRAAQEAQQLKTFSPLVELACIYRALFGHPFLSSQHAILPRADGDTSSDLLATTYTTYTGDELSRPPRLSSDHEQNIASGSFSISEPITLGGDSPITPSERPEERNSLERDNSFQHNRGVGRGNSSAASSTANGNNPTDRGVYRDRSAGRSPVDIPRPVELETDRVYSTGSSIPNGCSAIELATERGLFTESSTLNHERSAEPHTQRNRSTGSSKNFYNLSQFEPHSVHSARSSTWSERTSTGPESYGDCSAGSCAPNFFTPIEGEAFHSSVAEPLPSSLQSGSVQASGENNDNTLHWHENRLAENRSAGVPTTNGHITTEPEAQGNRLAANSSPTSNYHNQTEPEVNCSSVSEASCGPKTDPSRARDDSDALNWLDLARLRPALKIRPTVEGLRGSCPPLTGSLPSQAVLERESSSIPPLDPSTKIEIQEYVDRRVTGEENAGAYRRHGPNQPGLVVEDRPPVSLYSGEEKRGSLDSRTAVAGSLGEKAFEQDTARAQSGSEYVACVLGQTDQMEWDEETQPQSEKAKPAGAGLEGASNQPTGPKRPEEKTDHPDTSGGFRYGCEERSPSSQFGDDQHYYRTERLFSAEPFTNEESDQGDGGPKTEDPAKPTNESQKSNSISSASSSAKSDNHANIGTSSNPIFISNEGMSAFDTTEFTAHGSPRSPRAR